MSSNARIGIPEAINTLRAELSEAMKGAEEKELQFDVSSVELEFSVEMAREVGSSGGVKFWVVSVDGKETESTKTSHKVKLSLSPVTSTGNRARVADGVKREPQ